MPNDEEFDPFKPETGFKDDYDGTVTDAWFAMSDKGGDNILLFLSITADDGEEVENRYGCGGDWATYDGGETVEHPKGSRKGFNAQTKYAGFLAAAMEVGGEEELRKRSLSGKKTNDGIPLGPRSAALWKGTRWHFVVESKPYEFPDKNNPGEIVKGVSSTVKPSKYLGTGAAANGTGSSGGAPSASTTAAPASTTVAIPADLLASLTTAAKQSADFNSFIDAAMEISGVPENGDVMGKVADEAFYAELRA